MKRLSFKGSASGVLLSLAAVVLLLSGCAGLEGARRDHNPDPAHLAELAQAPPPSVRLIGSFPEMERLRPLALGPVESLLGSARTGRDQDQANAPRPEVIIYLDGWIDTPTTSFGTTFRAGRGFLEDERVLLIWGSIAWRINGQEVYSRPYSGNDTVWIRPFWPDPAYPTADDLTRILGQPDSLFQTLAAMIGRVYGTEALKRAAARPDQPDGRAAQAVLNRQAR